MDKEANMAPAQERGFNWAAIEAWFREYYWIALIVGILIVSIIVSAIIVCVCRTQLLRGLSQRFTKTFAVKRTHRRAEDSVYFVSNSHGIEAPPLPSRHTAAVEENNSYSYVDSNRSAVEGYFREPPSQSSQETFSYIDVLPEVEESDYDDAIILPQRQQEARTLHMH